MELDMSVPRHQNPLDATGSKEKESSRDTKWQDIENKGWECLKWLFDSVLESKIVPSLLKKFLCRIFILFCHKK